MSRSSLRLLAAAALFLGALATVQPVSGQRGGPVTLPDGPGKAEVEMTCTKCHGLNMITGGWGYSQQDWKEVFGSMVELPAAQANLIASYLGTHFDEGTRPKTVVVPGDLKVTFHEWIAPTLGSRPHDPLASADGTIYWAGMWGNVIGHVDPKSGAIKEYPINIPRSGPHGLTEDKDGNIWYAANFGGYIGKLNPKTGAITQYKMPDPAARDPHTPLFDRKGQLWFTLQNANMVGRLNPATGEIKLVKMPRPNSNPYGMVMLANGDPFICEFGGNRLAQFNIDTMAITEYELPNAESRPRRIALANNDVIYYADYSRGYLGRFDLKTKQTKEWPSPSGPQSQPYGIAVIDEVVWYNESAIRPNTLVRFDPKTEKFQSWIIPGGGGVVRNMMRTRDGNLAMAESGVNRVALVEIPKASAGTR